MNIFVYLRVKNKLIKSDRYSKYKIIVKKIIKSSEPYKLNCYL